MAATSAPDARTLAVAALDRAVYFLDRGLAAPQKVRAFRNARAIVSELDPDELADRVANQNLTELDDERGSSVPPEPAASLRRLEGAGQLWVMTRTDPAGRFAALGLRSEPYVVRARTGQASGAYPLLLTSLPAQNASLDMAVKCLPMLSISLPPSRNGVSTSVERLAMVGSRNAASRASLTAPLSRSRGRRACGRGRSSTRGGTSDLSCGGRSSTRGATSDLSCGGGLP